MPKTMLALQKPFQVGVFLAGVMHDTVLDNRSIVQKIWHSHVFTAWFDQHAKSLGGRTETLACYLCLPLLPKHSAYKQQKKTVELCPAFFPEYKT